jgi:ribosomal protein S3
MYALQLFQHELSEDGYAGVEIRTTPLRTEIIIRATRTQEVLGEKGKRIKELTSVVQKRCVHIHDAQLLVTHIREQVQVPGERCGFVC